MIHVNTQRIRIHAPRAIDSNLHSIYAKLIRRQRITVEFVEFITNRIDLATRLFHVFPPFPRISSSRSRLEKMSNDFVRNVHSMQIGKWKCDVVVGSVCHTRLIHVEPKCTTSIARFASAQWQTNNRLNNFGFFFCTFSPPELCLRIEKSWCVSISGHFHLEIDSTTTIECPLCLRCAHVAIRCIWTHRPFDRLESRETIRDKIIEMRTDRSFVLTLSAFHLNKLIRQSTAFGRFQMRKMPMTQFPVQNKHSSRASRTHNKQLSTFRQCRRLRQSERCAKAIEREKTFFFCLFDSLRGRSEQFVRISFCRNIRLDCESWMRVNFGLRKISVRVCEPRSRLPSQQME